MGKRHTLHSAVVVAAIAALCCAGEDPLPDLIEKAKPAVVVVTTYSKTGSPISTGSGFFTGPKRLITNYHVIEGADRADIKTSDGSTYHVTGILAQDKEWDLALLGVDMPDKAAGSVTVSETLPRQGERVVVIGAPMGLEASVSDGIVAAIREQPGVGKLIQITAPISHGSSGSPVMNLGGEVIGVATLKQAGGENLGFAVPAERISALKPGGMDSLLKSIEPASSARRLDRAAMLAPEQRALYEKCRNKYACLDGEYIHLPDFDLRYDNSRRGTKLPEKSKYAETQDVEYETVRDGPVVVRGFDRDGYPIPDYVPTKKVPRTVTTLVPVTPEELAMRETRWRSDLPDLKVGQFGAWPENEPLTVSRVRGRDDMIVISNGTMIRLKGWSTSGLTEGAYVGQAFAHHVFGSMAVIASRPVAGYDPKPILLAIPTAKVREGLTPQEFLEMLKSGVDPEKDEGAGKTAR